MADNIIYVGEEDSVCVCVCHGSGTLLGTTLSLQIVRLP